MIVKITNVKDQGLSPRPRKRIVVERTADGETTIRTVIEGETIEVHIHKGATVTIRDVEATL